ncbi:hypothetical protein HN51_050692 [Arachis hypogaea]
MHRCVTVESRGYQPNLLSPPSTVPLYSITSSSHRCRLFPSPPMNMSYHGLFPVTASKNLSRKHALFSHDVITVDNQTEAAAKEGSNSGSSSSMFHGANENKADWRTKSGSCLSPRSDYQQKKARLLFMQ